MKAALGVGLPGGVGDHGEGGAPWSPGPGEVGGAPGVGLAAVIAGALGAEVAAANVPTSIRRSGLPVVHGPVTDLGPVLDHWLAEHAEGIACVIGDPTFAGTARVRSLTPELVKGLEFDLVILVDPESFGPGIEGAVDRYVAMTRATQQLVVLTSRTSSRSHPRS